MSIEAPVADRLLLTSRAPARGWNSDGNAGNVRRQHSAGGVLTPSTRATIPVAVATIATAGTMSRATCGDSLLASVAARSPSVLVREASPASAWAGAGHHRSATPTSRAMVPVAAVAAPSALGGESVVHAALVRSGASPAAPGTPGPTSMRSASARQSRPTPASGGGAGPQRPSRSEACAVMPVSGQRARGAETPPVPGIPRTIACGGYPPPSPRSRAHEIAQRPFSFVAPSQTKRPSLSEVVPPQATQSWHSVAAPSQATQPSFSVAAPSQATQTPLPMNTAKHAAQPSLSVAAPSQATQHSYPVALSRGNQPQLPVAMALPAAQHAHPQLAADAVPSPAAPPRTTGGGGFMQPLSWVPPAAPNVGVVRTGPRGGAPEGAFLPPAFLGEGFGAFAFRFGAGGWLPPPPASSAQGTPHDSTPSRPASTGRSVQAAPGPDAGQASPPWFGPLQFVSAVYSRQHPAKRCTGIPNADVVEMTPGLLGLCDGVSGVHGLGISPDLLPRELLRSCREQHERWCRSVAEFGGIHSRGRGVQAAAGAQKHTAWLVDLAANAYDVTTAHGATTLLLAALRDGDQLVTASVGDSSLLLLRPSSLWPLRLKAVFKTKAGRYDAYRPVQVQRLHSISDAVVHGVIRAANVDSISVQSGDLLVVGSDGLFDNLADEDIRQAVEGHFSGSAALASLRLPPPDEVVDDASATTPTLRKLALGQQKLQEVADSLVDLAISRVRVTPAEREGNADDTTALVAAIVPGARPRRSGPPRSGAAAGQPRAAVSPRPTLGCSGRGPLADRTNAINAMGNEADEIKKRGPAAWHANAAGPLGARASRMQDGELSPKKELDCMGAAYPLGVADVPEDGCRMS
eukprot:CAMPEP_0117494382 /NCGR_PEP_ID=MMETSP0784-20121206/19583_1 /TAXON_ID=39447 /ORGANISM="" /LENGTH=859 /DNA_ID=CAMNT_0005289261 /DNA_START=41 /DNA_END=2620 /DNA_ORIENTATION=-